MTSVSEKLRMDRDLNEILALVQYDTTTRGLIRLRASLHIQLAAERAVIYQVHFNSASITVTFFQDIVFCTHYLILMITLTTNSYTEMSFVCLKNDLTVKQML